MQSVIKSCRWNSISFLFSQLQPFPCHKRSYQTQNSHSGIVFVNLWQELSTFLIWKKKKTFSCRWPTLCFCCCKKDPGMAFGLSSKEVTEWLQCLLPLCRFPKALTQCDSYSRFKPHGQGHRFWGWESKSSTQKHFHSVSRNFSLDGKGKRKKKKNKPNQPNLVLLALENDWEHVFPKISVLIALDSIGWDQAARCGCNTRTVLWFKKFFNVAEFSVLVFPI